MAPPRALALLPLLAALAAALAIPVDLPPAAAPGAHAPRRLVFLAGDLSEADWLAFAAAVVAGGGEPLLLWDAPGHAGQLERFLRAYAPDRIIPVGDCPNLPRYRAAAPIAPELRRPGGRPDLLWRELGTATDRVVVCPAAPRPRLLRAAYLAGLLRAPLCVGREGPAAAAGLRACLGAARPREVIAVGGSATLCKSVPGVRVSELSDETALDRAIEQALRGHGPVRTLVVANPFDDRDGMSNHARFAPWLALRRGAAVVWTNPAGTDVEEAVAAARARPYCRGAEHVLLLGDRCALPPRRRADPLSGTSAHIDTEPLTPAEGGLYRYAVGRIFHPCPETLLLREARQRLFEQRREAPRALVASNPGGGLELLELCSRRSARELGNAGLRVRGLFGRDVRPGELRLAMTRADLFLWEGHSETLVEKWKFPEWDEPLPPSLVVLQSCTGLEEATALPVLDRGAVAVVGSTARTYSASGGAFALAFLDAMLYDGRTVGGALRQANNFLLMYADLKEERLGGRARMGGANLRAAWTFALWGDPTLRPPRPPEPRGALPPVRWRVEPGSGAGHTIRAAIPGQTYPVESVGEYRAQSWA
ncbi:MAG TPA: C25 family cysteine peptidase, partial [Gemmataceae bacterium]